MITNRKKLIQAIEASGKFRDKGNAITPMLQMIKIDPEKGEVIATDLEAYAVSYFKAEDFTRGAPPVSSDLEPMLKKMTKAELVEEYSEIGGFIADTPKADMLDRIIKAKTPAPFIETFCCEPIQLRDLLKIENDEEIEIVLSDNKSSIAIGKNFSDMPAFDIEDFPDIPDVTGTMECLFSITKKQIGALTALKGDAYENRAHIVGAYFSGEKGRAVSTDIKRLNMITINNAVKHNPFIVSKKHLQLCAGLSKEKIDIHEINGMYLFTVDNDVDTAILARPLECEFPRYEDLVKKHDAKIVFTKEEIIPACQKAIQVMSNEFAGCICNFNGDLKMHIANPIKGTYKKVVPYKAHTEGINIELALNPQFLMDAIKNLKGDDVEISIREDSHVILTAPDDNKNVNIIMPMKI